MQILLIYSSFIDKITLVKKGRKLLMVLDKKFNTVTLRFDSSGDRTGISLMIYLRTVVSSTQS